MIDKKVILFGSGPEIGIVLEQLYDKVNVVAFCTESTIASRTSDNILFCEEHNIPILEHYSEIDNYEPDFIFLASYASLIASSYVEKYTFINVHNALLPRYRGLHAQAWAIINGETKHGFTVHKIGDGIDNGPIYHQSSFDITTEEDINSVRKKYFALYEKEIIQILLNIFSEKCQPKPQEEDKAFYVTRRYESDSLIDWEWNSELILNHIRALAPPYTAGAFTYYKGQKVYLTKAHLTKMPIYFSATGKVLAKVDNGVLIKTGTNPILVNEICVDGKKINPALFFKTVGITLKNK